jgi:glycosyltransferase involved in cell wall biosynthesis
VIVAFKILQLISSGGVFGAENVMLDLSSELVSSGHAVTIGLFNNLLNPNLDLLKVARERKIETVVFDCRARLDPRTIFQIAAFLKEREIDLIHSHGYKSNIYAVLSNCLNKRKLVSTCHSWVSSGRKMKFYTGLDKMFLKRFDRIIPVSEPVRTALVNAGIRKEKIIKIGNGINLRPSEIERNRPESIRRSLVSDPEGVVIGTVCRLHSAKGITYLLKAARTLLDKGKNCYFIIVGDGPEKGELEREAKELQLEKRVIFTGVRSDIGAVNAAIDIFVLPSLQEGQPIALLEAMVAGKPVIATRVGDVAQMLREGDAGYLVPPADSKSISDAIIHILDYPEEAEKLAARGRKEVLDHHSSAHMAEEYLGVYRQLVSGV